MVVEIPPGAAAVTAGKTIAGGSSTEIPPVAVAAAVGRQFAVGRTDSTEIPPGVTAAMAVTGNQSTSEGGDSESTTGRQPAAARL